MHTHMQNDFIICPMLYAIAMRQIKMRSSEETVQAIVREGSPGGRSETTGGRICETGWF